MVNKHSLYTERHVKTDSGEVRHGTREDITIGYITTLCSQWSQACPYVVPMTNMLSAMEG